MLYIAFTIALFACTFFFIFTVYWCMHTKNTVESKEEKKGESGKRDKKEEGGGSTPLLLVWYCESVNQNLKIRQKLNCWSTCIIIHEAWNLFSQNMADRKI